MDAERRGRPAFDSNGTWDTDGTGVAARRRLLAAARDPDAADLPGLPTTDRYDNLATIDTVTTPKDWRTGWVAKHLERRRASSWAAEIQAVKLGGKYA